MADKNKSFHSNISNVDAENVEPLQLFASTPWKSTKKKTKRILRDDNSWNISVINNKQDQNKKVGVDIYNQRHTPTIPIVEDNYKHNQTSVLFYSDPEDESSEIVHNTCATVINDFDDKWTTLTNVSEDKNCTNISELLDEIEEDVEPKFDKPPRRSYPGRKRNNKSMFEDEEKVDEVDVKIAKKCRKRKQKNKIDPNEEVFIMSINEHFNDVETFNLSVE